MKDGNYSRRKKACEVGRLFSQFKIWPKSARLVLSAYGKIGVKSQCSQINGPLKGGQETVTPSNDINCSNSDRADQASKYPTDH